MGHKVLLADDSITIQKVIELTFSDEDFELHTVGNGQKAIDEIRSVRPDIVLCDIIMPEKNGYEVCEFIKSSDDLKQIPVLLLTGAFEPFDQERAKAAGCEGFLAKPFEPQTLISKVKELLAGATGGVAQAAAPPAQPPAPVPVAPPPAPVPDFASMPIEDETVLVVPPSLGAPPPVKGPQIPATPVPPPIDPPGIEGFEGLDEAFAVEAGERELAMDPGDHTMLLAAPDAPAAPPPPSTSGDDIWSEMPEAPAPPAAPAPMAPEPLAIDEDAQAATVFMSPPLVSESSDAGTGATIEEELNPSEAEDPDATWQAPSETPAAIPPTQVDGDFGDAPSSPAPVTDAQPPAEPPTIAIPIEPPLAADPFSEPTGDDVAQPIPSVDAPAVATPPEPPIPEPPVPPVPIAPSNMTLPSPAPDASSEPETPKLGGADDDLVERIAQRVVDKLSSKVIQEIAWEVVPDLAEGLIQKEIDVLKSKMPKSG